MPFYPKLAFALPPLAWSLVFLSSLAAQDWDPGTRAASAVSVVTRNTLILTFEQRERYEDRTGSTSGDDPDVFAILVRTRLGMSLVPVWWLKFSAMIQDARAPLYGPGAPGNIRDPADLHEAYIEVFPAAKEGFGIVLGRKMTLNYGDGRLIGISNWSNTSRSYDQARIYWRSPRVQAEVLLVSVVKVRIGEFNRPVLGDRVWGTYEVFPDFYKHNLLEAYLLRHDQNRPGGFSGGSPQNGTDKLGINTFGLRLTGPLSYGVKYNLEAARQKGKVGTATLSASAWTASLNRRTTIAGKPLDLAVEYKFASGTADPTDPTRSGTFDQLYAADHDKFGHQDLFGWRNLHDARSLGTWSLTRRFAVNFQYNDFWLASLKDGIYNGAGKLIVRSAAGTAGRHVGQETDMYGTYKYGHFTFGAGYGRFFRGQFLQKTTPGLGPTYLYIFHTYSL